MTCPHFSRLSTWTTLALIALPRLAHASPSSGGGAMPWEGPLNQVLASISGPVAKALCVLAIIVFGISVAYSEGGGLRKVLSLLLGLSIAATATSFGVSFFGFDGGAGY